MPGREPRPGDIYQHFKGNKYQVTAIAYDAQTEEKCVVYQALYGEFKTYVRKYDEFISAVDKEKYPQVSCRYRFSSLDELTASDGSEKEAEGCVADRAEVDGHADGAVSGGQTWSRSTAISRRRTQASSTGKTSRR